MWPTTPGARRRRALRAFIWTPIQSSPPVTTTVYVVAARTTDRNAAELEEISPDYPNDRSPHGPLGGLTVRQHRSSTRAGFASPVRRCEKGSSGRAERRAAPVTGRRRTGQCHRKHAGFAEWMGGAVASRAPLRRGDGYVAHDGHQVNVRDSHVYGPGTRRLAQDHERIRQHAELYVRSSLEDSKRPDCSSGDRKPIYVRSTTATMAAAPEPSPRRTGVGDRRAGAFRRSWSSAHTTAAADLATHAPPAAYPRGDWRRPPTSSRRATPTVSAIAPSVPYSDPHRGPRPNRRAITDCWRMRRRGPPSRFQTRGRGVRT